MQAPAVAPRFPKIESPFKRHENAANEYVVYDEWNVDPSWFKGSTIAVEKLDGTNCAVWLDDSVGPWVTDVFTRMGDKSMNYVHPFPHDTNKLRIARAVQNSVAEGYFDGLQSGYHYGEVIGPKIQGNPHEVDEHLFIPFEWARDNLRYESWGEYGQDFDDLSEWFKDGLFSLFHTHYHGVGLDEASVSNGAFCEGIMFTDRTVPLSYTYEEQPEADHFAKLRRDMFDWYTGRRH